MCVVSMIGDHYRDKWTDRPWMPTSPTVWPDDTTWKLAPEVSRAEFDALKREVLEMKELLKRAKEYDERNSEPNCEVDEKMDLLRRVAAAVGINLDDVLGAKEPSA